MPPEYSKKRKRGAVVLHQHQETHSQVNTAKPSSIFKPTKGRTHTLSIALPGSVISNAQTHDLKTALVGHIARAAAVFCVDEIIIFNDGQSLKGGSQHQDYHNNNRRSLYNQGYNQGYNNGGRYEEKGNNQGDDEHTGWSDPDYFLFHLLSYLETPPHFRKMLFPLHPNLRTAGALPSLDMPHHMRSDEWCQYREGVTVEEPSDTSYGGGGGYGGYNNYDEGRKAKYNNKKRKSQQPSEESSSTTSYVEVGLPMPIPINTSIPPNTRVTLKFTSQDPPTNYDTPPQAEPVAPSAPREEAGYFWGYTTRMASSLSTIFTECPFEDGYDLSIGTSERGVSLSSILPPENGGKSSSEEGEGSTTLPSFNHLLLVFGGVAGLESAVSSDTELGSKGITKDNVSDLFDAWVNVLPGQGSRTIRTEEAVWLALMGLREFVQSKGK